MKCPAALVLRGPRAWLSTFHGAFALLASIRAVGIAEHGGTPFVPWHMPMHGLIGGLGGLARFTQVLIHPVLSVPDLVALPRAKLRAALLPTLLHLCRVYGVSTLLTGDGHAGIRACCLASNVSPSEKSPQDRTHAPSFQSSPAPLCSRCNSMPSVGGRV